MSSPARVRYHALDSLRAVAMLLGLVLHAAVCYRLSCPEWWAVIDSSRSAFFDHLVFVVHAFRMQVFFVMAGFFAYLLRERIGTAAFIRHRLVRIAIPFAAALLTIGPLMYVVWAYGDFLKDPDHAGASFWASAVLHLRETGIGVLENVWHLWFLEYLLIFYAVMLLVAPLGRLVPRTVADGIDAAIRWIVAFPGRPLIIAIPTLMLMFLMPGWEVAEENDIVPEVRLLAYYAFYFLAGWLLFRVRTSLGKLGHWWLLYLALAVLVVYPVLGALKSMLEPGASALNPAVVNMLGRAASALLTTLLVFGAIGFFVERANKPSRAMRYVADSSYWLYLVHFPLIIYLNIQLARFEVPGFFKFAAIVLVAPAVLLLSYQVLVRYTIIGFVLNGPRGRKANTRHQTADSA